MFEVLDVIKLDYEDAKVAERLHANQEEAWDEYSRATEEVWKKHSRATKKVWKKYSRATEEFSDQLVLFYGKHRPLKPGDSIHPNLNYRDGYLVHLLARQERT